MLNKYPIRRRELVTCLAGSAASRLFAHSEAARAAAVLINVKDRRVLSMTGADLARRWIVAPGSTIKPLSLLALIEGNKLRPTDEYVCPGKLVLNGRVLNCSHPVIGVPMNVSRAISYSCNCAVAHFARRFERGELPNFLRRFGLASLSGLSAGDEATGFVRADVDETACQLEALGEDGVRVSALEMLAAYRRLAVQGLGRRAADAQMTPIIEGLEGAVEFGNGQAARLEQVRVAGKTGSVRMASGTRAAWFVGFAPSRSPEVAVIVLLQGRSGGADAAPIAGRILRTYFGSRP